MSWIVPGGAGGFLGWEQDAGLEQGEQLCWSQTRFPASVASKLVPLDAVMGCSGAVVSEAPW